MSDPDPKDAPEAPDQNVTIQAKDGALAIATENFT